MSSVRSDHTGAPTATPAATEDEQWGKLEVIQRLADEVWA